MESLTARLHRCRNCGTELDTGFLTHCPECGTPAGLSEVDDAGGVGGLNASRRPTKWAMTGVAAVIVVVIGMLLGVFGDAGRDASGTVTESVTIQVADVRVGDCVLLPQDRDGLEVTTVRAVPCRRPHDLEKFAEARHPAGEVAWIGEDAMAAWAAATCTASFGDRLVSPLPGSAGDEVSYLYPAQEAWERGDRTVHCYRR
jgi:hypothetical protein